MTTNSITVDSLALPPLRWNWGSFIPALSIWHARRSLLKGRSRRGRADLYMIKGLILSLQETRDRAASESNLRSAARHYVDHLNVVANATSVLLSRIAKDQAAVTIKLLSEGAKGVPSVVTVSRDKNSMATREKINAPNLFPYLENTAFEQILQNKDRGGYYAADDLSSLAAVGKYRNAHDSWPMYYNSTAVAAIRANSMGQSPIVGFVCVDTLFGRLSRLQVRLVLELVASHLFNVFSELEALFAEPESRGANEGLGWLVAEKQESDEIAPVVECDRSRQREFERILTMLTIQFFIGFGSVGAQDAPLLSSGGVNWAPQKTELTLDDEKSSLLVPGVIDPRLARQALEDATLGKTRREFVADFWERKPDVAAAIGLVRPESLTD